MPEYAAHVATSLTNRTIDHAGYQLDDVLDEIVDQLAPLAGVPSMLDGYLTVQVTVEADDLTAATAVATDAVVRAARAAAPGLGIDAVAVEVLNQDES
jgi:hypothetical protein